MSTVPWTVPTDHPAFAGHFPARPIVPGVVLLDRVMQVVAATHGEQVVGVGSAKFLSPVGPGATLEFSTGAVTGRSVRFDIASDAGVAVATGTLKLAG
jgi:3-hydroxymyristoyl/3-hydroxydecanoyl-(acyl carrier protein) dehydratase